MGTLTYKVFNLYFFKQCGTSYSHLYTIISSSSVSSFTILSLKWKLYHPHTLVASSEAIQLARCLTTTMLERFLIQEVSLLLKSSALIPLFGHHKEHLHWVKNNSQVKDIFTQNLKVRGV